MRRPNWIVLVAVAALFAAAVITEILPAQAAAQQQGRTGSRGQQVRRGSTGAGQQRQSARRSRSRFSGARRQNQQQQRRRSTASATRRRGSSSRRNRTSARSTRTGAAGRGTGIRGGTSLTGARGAGGTTGTGTATVPTPSQRPNPNLGPESTAPSRPVTPPAPGNDATGTGANRGGGTLLAVLRADPQFSTLVRAINAAGLAATFEGQGPFTMFAPTNTAFERLAAGQLDTLLQPASRAQLMALLNYHVLPGRLTTANISNLGNPATPKTLQGQTLRLITAPAISLNNGAAILQADIPAGNGVVHAIDTVLTPPPAGSPL